MAHARRDARARQLTCYFTTLRREHQNRLRYRIRILKKQFKSLKTRSKLTFNGTSFSSDSLEMSSGSDSDDISLSDLSTGENDLWDDILGQGWRWTRELEFSDASISSDLFATDFELPDLHSIFSSRSSDSSGSSGYGGDADSDFDSDILDESNESDGSESLEDAEAFQGAQDRWSHLRRWVITEVREMYANRYEMSRNELPRGPSLMKHCLLNVKNIRPDKFREELRVSPLTFDALVSRLESDLVFSNNSNAAQMPVEEQLTITLYRFGHDGNAASLQSIANWAAVGKGTVSLVTRRVMTAVLRKDFMDEAVRFPTTEEKEEAKKWVHKHSCRAWHDGWCFVDGTLVPLAERPHWFGESYFDRKSRYSLNIVSLPNLRIIDFAYGHTGSTHDATAWVQTRLAKEHEVVMHSGEWVWADSAYPVDTWVVAPYKKPERDLPDNEVFNTQVSMLRIRSEHAIGYLKGRFHSLKNLRVNIKDRKAHILATYWVAACVGLHSFAMACEAREQQADSAADDPFIAEGLSSSDSDDNTTLPVSQANIGARHLQAGKRHRENLKASLFQHKECRDHRTAHARIVQYGISSASDTSGMDMD